MPTTPRASKKFDRSYRPTNDARDRLFNVLRKPEQKKYGYHSWNWGNSVHLDQNDPYAAGQIKFLVDAHVVTASMGKVWVTIDGTTEEWYIGDSQNEHEMAESLAAFLTANFTDKRLFFFHHFDTVRLVAKDIDDVGIKAFSLEVDTTGDGVADAPIYSTQVELTEMDLGQVGDWVLLHVEPSNIRGHEDWEQWWYGPASLYDDIVSEDDGDGRYRRSVLYPKWADKPVVGDLTGVKSTALLAGVFYGEASGIFANKYKLAGFQFRDAVVDIQYRWDDELGMPIKTTKTLMEHPQPVAATTTIATTGQPNAGTHLRIAYGVLDHYINFVSGTAGEGEISRDVANNDILLNFAIIAAINGSDPNFPGGIPGVTAALATGTTCTVTADEPGAVGNTFEAHDTDPSVTTVNGAFTGGEDGATPDGSATETKTISYDQISDYLMWKVEVEAVTDAPYPEYADIEMPTSVEVPVPTILTAATGMLVSAWAQSGGYRAEQIDFGVDWDTLAAKRYTQPGRIVRKIFSSSTAATAYLATLSFFRFTPAQKTFSVPYASWYAGRNVLARATIRNFASPVALVPTQITISFFDTVRGELFEADDVIIEATPAVSWGSEVVWEAKPRQSRWGYWIVDVIHVTLPAQPYP